MRRQRSVMFSGPVSKGWGCRGRPVHQSPSGGVAEDRQGWVKYFHWVVIVPEGGVVVVVGGGRGGNGDRDDDDDGVR